MTSTDADEPPWIAQTLPELHLRSIGKDMELVPFFKKHREKYCEMVEKQITFLIEVNGHRPADGAVRKAVASWILTEEKVGDYVQRAAKNGLLHDPEKVANLAEAAAGTLLAIYLHDTKRSA